MAARKKKKTRSFGEMPEIRALKGMFTRPVSRPTGLTSVNMNAQKQFVKMKRQSRGGR